MARRQAEQRASGAEAVIAHLKLLIAKMRHERFGASSERGRKLLNQLELQLEEIEAAAAEDSAVVEVSTPPDATGPASTRRQPVRAPFPAHLPRERVVIPGPAACPCCNGKLTKLGKDVTETLEVIPRQWKVIQTVRERFTCRACEIISQVPAPFHVIPRGRAGPELLAMILEAKFGQHLPLNRRARPMPARASTSTSRHRRTGSVADLQAWMMSERGKLSRHAEVARAMDTCPSAGRHSPGSWMTAVFA